MNVIACYKVAPEEQDIIVKIDGTLSMDRAEWTIGGYDLPAIEAGMNIVEEVGGKMSILSIGNKKIDNSKLIKGALSRGPEELFMVIDENLMEADAYQTAATLAAALQKMEFDLVLCGEGSSDLYAQQVGPQLGEQLGINVFNAVSKITPKGDTIIVERMLENEVEVLEVSLPAVISVTTDINMPRIPQLKDILAAGKKPNTKWSLEDIGIDAESTMDVVSTLAPNNVSRKQIIVEGDTEEDIASFVRSIKKAI